jgi:type I restriction enzyme, S subunit
MNASQLLKHFDRLAEAPDAVARLRRFILDLAVRGKLVEQDAGDEPASGLLRRIAAQKAELVKEGQLREQPVTIDVPRSKQPFEIKLNWKWATFGSIMISRDGERIPVSKEIRNTREKIYDYYGASGVIDKIDGFLFDKPLLLIGEDGANLINRSTPIAFIARGKYWVNNHAHVLDGISENFLKYIELYINAIDLKAYVTGTAQPKMNQAKMNSIPVAIPPEKEQHRIVAKVDELMALCDKLEAAQQERERRRDRLAAASLQRLNQPAADTTPEEQREHARFHLNHLPRLITRPGQIKAMRETIRNLAIRGRLALQNRTDEPAKKLLERNLQWRSAAIKRKQIREPRNELVATDDGISPYPLPMLWSWARIGEVIYIQSGDGLTAANMKDGTVPVFGGNGINGHHNACNVEVPTLVIGRVGYYCGSIHITPEKAWITDNAFVTHFCPDLFALRFLALLLATTNLKENEGATAQPVISGSKIYPIIVGIPPLAEQHRIVAKVDELMALCDQLEAQLTITRTNSRRLLEAVLA